MRLMKWITLFSFIYLVFCFRFGTVDGGKILFGYAPQALSHFRSMLPLAERLARAGHEISVFHTIPKAREFQGPPNITFIPVDYCVGDTAMSGMGDKIWRESFHGFMLIFPIVSLSQISVAYLRNSTEQVKEVLNTDWDLVIISSLFNVHTTAFAEILARERGVPSAIFASTSVFPSSAYSLSMGHSLASIPALLKAEPLNFDDGFDVTKFSTRLVNVFEILGDFLSWFLSENFVYPSAMRAFGAQSYNKGRFMSEILLHFTDMPEFISFPTPQITPLRSVGAHCKRSAQLSEDYIRFVEDPTSKGTVYIAFGTIIPWDYAPERLKEIFFDALGKLTDYRVIFSFKGKFPDRKMPPHVRLAKWVPQLDILAHKNTKVFLTHGGLKSFKEGICTKTPMLVMPMFAEQARNAELVVRLGLGGALNKYTLSVETILDGLARILDNADRYVSRATKLHAMFLDRPIPDLDDGEFFVSRLIRLRRREQERQKSSPPPTAVNSNESVSGLCLDSSICGNLNRTKFAVNRNFATFDSNLHLPQKKVDSKIVQWPKTSGEELFFKRKGMELSLAEYLYAEVFVLIFVGFVILAWK